MRAADLEHFAPVRPMNAEDYALALDALGHHGSADFIRSRESLLGEVALFLRELPDDLGRGSLNGMRAQLLHKLEAP